MTLQPIMSENDKRYKSDLKYNPVIGLYIAVL